MTDISKYHNPYFTDESFALITDFVSTLKLEKTKQTYLSQACSITSYARTDFALLSKANVRDYFNSLAGLGRKTLSKKLSILRSIARRFDEVYGHDLISSFTGITEACADEYVKMEDLPAVSDVAKVLSYLDARNEHMLYAVLSLAIETGLSTDELCSLKYSDFYYDPSGQRFIKLKEDELNAPERFIPLKEKTADLIEKIGAMRKGALKSSHIFVNKRSSPLTERVLQMRLREACQKAGVKPFGIAKCRNLAISHILAAGGPVESLSYQLNLTDRWFFRYNHVVKSLKTSAIGMNPLNADNIVKAGRAAENV